MIASLKGTITHIDEKSIILEVNNVGYKIFTTTNNLHSAKIGSNQSLLTYLAVRENALDLYGFTNQKERDLFELLISVSGIGPKGALNVLSAVSTETLTNAISTGSVTNLVKVSGIGRKTAEKIVLELKDKLDTISDGQNSDELSSDSDVIEALKMLGYGTDEARESLKKIDKNITDTGNKIKAVLKILN